MYELVLKRLKQWLCMYPCGYTRRAMNDDLPPRRYVPAVQSASGGEILAVVESLTPAPLPRLAFEDGESRFMDMSEVVKTDTAQAIFNKMREVSRDQGVPPGPARLELLVGYEKFFEDLGFSKRTLFDPGWKGHPTFNLRYIGQTYGSKLEPSQIRYEFGKAARYALQCLQGRCAGRYGRIGTTTRSRWYRRTDRTTARCNRPAFLEFSYKIPKIFWCGCRDIGSALGYSCRAVVHLNHTQDNKTKTPSELFKFIRDEDDFDAFKAEVATLEARVNECHCQTGTAATSVADHRRLDQQPLLLEAVILANPNPGPPRTVPVVIDYMSTPGEFYFYFYMGNYNDMMFCLQCAAWTKLCCSKGT